MEDANKDKNVLLVVMDTARKKNLTPYGYERNTTPFLEDFSEESVVFDNATSQAPWTLPSHASMFTGEYPSQHGATQESPYLEKGDTLASHMSDEGYRTAIYSANAWISPHTGLARGYDEANNFFGALPNRMEGILSGAWKKINDSDRLQTMASKIVSFGAWIYENFSSNDVSSFTPDAIESSKKFMKKNDKPFFLTVNLLDPHLPYKPPIENIKNVSNLDERPEICQNSKQYNSGAVDINDEDWNNIRAMYDGELNFLDQQLESLHKWMNDRNILKDTMVIICSDHGELLGEHNLYGHEFGMYEELVNVPLMISHPTEEEGRVDKPVELLDLYHTILDFAGSDEFNEERSIFNSNYREDSTQSLPYPECAFSEYARPIIELEQLRSISSSSNIDISKNSRFDSRMYSVRKDGMKLIRIENVKDEMYNLSEDKEEENNLIEQEDSSDMYKRIAENENIGNLEAGKSPGIDAVDNSIKDRLSDLGYLE
jgi:arylsulfatase A-like enzyme